MYHRSKAERYGAAHQLNWKKTGLSRAYFKTELVTEERMPTPRAAAAFRYLQTHNVFYNRFHSMHEKRKEDGLNLNVSSYDLFASMDYRCIECAMFPHLYPRSEFTDTGIMMRYQEDTSDDTNRVCSIGQSWTRKVLSGVRSYGEQRELSFFSV